MKEQIFSRRKIKREICGVNFQLVDITLGTIRIHHDRMNFYSKTGPCLNCWVQSLGISNVVAAVMEFRGSSCEFSAQDSELPKVICLYAFRPKICDNTNF